MQLLSPPNCQRSLEPSPAVRPQRGGRAGPSSAEQVAPCFQGVTASEIASSWLSPTACGNSYCSGLADCVNPSAENFPSELLVWRWGDSNPRHPTCKAGALPLSYIPAGSKPSVWAYLD